MIRSVVFTPTSEVMSASSKESSTSSSIVDLPAIAWLILLSTDSLLFSSPLSKVSFFSLLNNPKNAILINVYLLSIVLSMFRVSGSIYA